MGALDSVLTDVGSQLGISTSSAGALMSGLLSLINQDAGGLSGFLDRFRRAGVGNLVTSWLGGDAKAVSTDAIESALGHDTISQMASRAGLSFSTALSAVSLMVPKLVQRIAPGGMIPSRLSSEFVPYMAGPGAAGARQGTAAAEDTTAKAGGMSLYLWPVLGALLLVGLLTMWLSNPETVNHVAFNADEQVQLAAQRAKAALSALGSRFTAPDLVNALNLEVINFASGSAVIPSDAYDFLNKAAVAFTNAPATMVVEVGGHTDNSGDPSANMQLSEQRAAAVRDYLIRQGVSPAMLTSKGYGDTKPIATNSTDEGRFRNRRIEFSVK
jgi:outer membrane protein OmpA-like peptidoglycan-associated protein/uncharacterized protein YidB (DUF937 family)